MICTVTLNPSLDYTVELEQLQPGGLNRTRAESVRPGGKGLNVALMLNRLGQPVRALAFAAGYTGHMLAGQLADAGLPAELLWAREGMTRINVKVKAGEETEINGRGPVLGPSHLEELASRLAVLEEGDWVVLAGSLPAGLPDDTYARLLMPLTARGVRAVVDAEGAVLSAALTAHPFLIKPNRPELEALAGRALSTREELFDAARTLQEKGAANVLLSLGGEGAALLTSSGERLFCPAPQGKAVDTVGAGDSMVAGFLSGWLTTGRWPEALRMGVAAGSASAFSPWIARREQVWALYDSVLI